MKKKSVDKMPNFFKQGIGKDFPLYCMNFGPNCFKICKTRKVFDMKKDLISVTDFGKELEKIIDYAIELKRKRKEGKNEKILKGKTLGMLFEKPSLRTRVSFETGMLELGGNALYLSPDEVQIGEREQVSDVANVLSRYLDIIVYRAKSYKNMKKLAKYAKVPVINALDDMEHPCQIAADLMTIKEKKGQFIGLKLAYLGDGNNVCNSLLLGSALVGMDISVATPENFMPNLEILEKAKKIAENNNSKIEICHKGKECVVDADVVYTDTWISMGDEKEREKRLEAFKDFQVNSHLVKLAKPDYIFMHCLPAHRGEEVTSDVIDSVNSVIFDEAENRLHAQKSIMVWLLKDGNIS